MTTELFVGLISGTSMDGIDAVLVRFENGRIQLVQSRECPWPPSLKEELRALALPGGNDIDRLGAADAWAGDALAHAVRDLLAAAQVPAAQVKAVGSHGQTVRHRPRAARPFTLQIGDPSRIAEGSGITTVADFRRRDIAAGGEGAPLVPAFHDAVFRDRNEDRAVLNIGGIANITALPASSETPILGFDTGPGNRLLDDWIQRQQGRSFDPSGTWAASGRVHKPLLRRLLADPYFDQPPPKSTGTEHFNLDRVRQLAPELPDLPPEDVQATFAELTARSIAEALLRHAPATLRLLVCGGGSHNADLMARLDALLSPIAIESTAAHGIDPDWVEAIAFAWLARETLAGRPGNLPAVTGARGPRVLGAVYPA